MENYSFKDNSIELRNDTILLSVIISVIIALLALGLWWTVASESHERKYIFNLGEARILSNNIAHNAEFSLNRNKNSLENHFKAIPGIL